jgi:amphiphysin
MADVIAQWAASFRPIQRQVESIGCIARGKAITHPMTLNENAQPGDTSGKEPRRTPSGLVPARTTAPARIPSASSLSLRSPSPGTPSDISPRPSIKALNSSGSGLLKPTDFTNATVLSNQYNGSSPRSPNSSVNRQDYFSREQVSALSNNNGAIIVKKKPPPPPPQKRVTRPDEFVVAQYDFSGQGQGDLSFREGDRIKIIKKTDTDQDWWVGEIAGQRGNFPANYCKAV